MANGTEPGGFSEFAAGLLRDVRDDAGALRGEISGLRHETLTAERDLKLLEERHDRDVRSLTEKLVSETNVLAEKITAISRPNWVAIAAVLGFVAFILPATWYILSAFVEDKINIATGRIAVNTEILHNLSSVVDDLSKRSVLATGGEESARADRSQINERLRQLETKTSEADARISAALAEETASRRTQYAANRVSLAEIETQFKSASDIANLRGVQQERFNAMIWQELHPGKSYPTMMFFPNSFGSPPDNTVVPESR